LWLIKIYVIDPHGIIVMMHKAYKKRKFMNGPTSVTFEILSRELNETELNETEFEK